MSDQELLSRIRWNPVLAFSKPTTLARVTRDDPAGLANYQPQSLPVVR